MPSFFISFSISLTSFFTVVRLTSSSSDIREKFIFSSSRILNFMYSFLSFFVFLFISSKNTFSSYAAENSRLISLPLDSFFISGNLFTASIKFSLSISYLTAFSDIFKATAVSFIVASSLFFKNSITFNNRLFIYTDITHYTY